MKLIDLSWVSLTQIARVIGCICMIALSACNSTSSRVKAWEAQLGPVPVEKKLPPAGLLKEARLKQDLIPRGTVGRKQHRPMRPQYVTIHSTQNYNGDAHAHALALKRGSLRATKRPGGNRIGFLTWHFTTQDNIVIQHLPTNEQGEHADFDGPGNNFSIGIEMCEHHGNNLALTLENTARLSAFLMYEHRIPLSNVVAHYHWPRRGLSVPHKNCPHFLLDRGKPGATWRWFQNRVGQHYQRIIPGPIPRI